MKSHELREGDQPGPACRPAARPAKAAYPDGVPRPLVTAVAAAMLVAVSVTGCGGSGSPQSVATPTPVASPAAAQASPTCSAPPATDFSWPEEVPDDLPVPPGARLTDVQERTDGLTVVMFTTPVSIRESVLFLIEKMPAAGYTLARGDAENTEADAPFVKGELKGVMRMIAVEDCRTDWLMAITTGVAAGAPGGGTPLLPPRADASPLPFG